MIKLRAPASLSSFSHEGYPLEIADDGSVKVPPHHVDTLMAHGFERWNDAPGTGGNIETMTREQLIEAAVARTRVEAAKLDTDKLRDYLRGGPKDDDDDVPSEAEIAAANVDPEAVTEERIATMKRSELFAYLAAKKVSSPPPVKNEVLRERALEAFRKSV